MKYAFVTGGSRGIGKAISIALAKDGYYVLINFKTNITEAKSTLAEIEQNGGCGELLQFDISKSSEVEEALGNWMKINGDAFIEVLVNNAGVTRDNLMVFMSDDDWEGVMSTNLDSFFYVTRILLKNMLVNKCGRIINMVSLSGQKGQPGQVNYAATKGAIIAATKSLAMEIGKKKVTVNAVAPGFIKTEMTAALNEKELRNIIPLNRFGEAEEVAAVVSFLASDKSSYITGETISVNGGMYS
jgi:3-oxoacyl-[acyl-carrier protein] reductase